MISNYSRLPFNRYWFNVATMYSKESPKELTRKSILKETKPANDTFLTI
jgi:hypothetical protein